MSRLAIITDTSTNLSHTSQKVHSQIRQYVSIDQFSQHFGELRIYLYTSLAISHRDKPRWKCVMTRKCVHENKPLNMYTQLCQKNIRKSTELKRERETIQHEWIVTRKKKKQQGNNTIVTRIRETGMQCVKAHVQNTQIQNGMYLKSRILYGICVA